MFYTHWINFSVYIRYTRLHINMCLRVSVYSYTFIVLVSGMEIMRAANAGMLAAAFSVRANFIRMLFGCWRYMYVAAVFFLSLAPFGHKSLVSVVNARNSFRVSARLPAHTTNTSHMSAWHTSVWLYAMCVTSFAWQNHRIENFGSVRHTQPPPCVNDICT